MALSNRSQLAMLADRAEEAIALGEEAMELARTVDDPATLTRSDQCRSRRHRGAHDRAGPRRARAVVRARARRPGRPSTPCVRSRTSRWRRSSVTPAIAGSPRTSIERWPSPVSTTSTVHCSTCWAHGHSFGCFAASGMRPSRTPGLRLPSAASPRARQCWCWVVSRPGAARRRREERSTRPGGSHAPPARHTGSRLRSPPWPSTRGSAETHEPSSPRSDTPTGSISGARSSAPSSRTGSGVWMPSIGRPRAPAAATPSPFGVIGEARPRHGPRWDSRMKPLTRPLPVTRRRCLKRSRCSTGSVPCSDAPAASAAAARGAARCAARAETRDACGAGAAHAAAASRWLACL